MHTDIHACSEQARKDGSSDSLACCSKKMCELLWLSKQRTEHLGRYLSCYQGLHVQQLILSRGVAQYGHAALAHQQTDIGTRQMLISTRNSSWIFFAKVLNVSALKLRKSLKFLSSLSS